MKTLIGVLYGLLIATMMWAVTTWLEDPPEILECECDTATTTPAADVPDEALIIPHTYDAPPPPTETVIIYNPTSTERVIERETRIEERETNNIETVREEEEQPDQEPEDNGGIISDLLDIL